MKVILSIIGAFSCIFIACSGTPCTAGWNVAPYVQCWPHNAARLKHTSNAGASVAEAQRISLARNALWNGGYSWESGRNTVFFNYGTVTFYEEEIAGECHCYGDRDVDVYACTNVPTQKNPGGTNYCRVNPTARCHPGPFHMVTGHFKDSWCPGP